MIENLLKRVNEKVKAVWIVSILGIKGKIKVALLGARQ